VERLPLGDTIRLGGWCLDLGCGAGRYAECLAERGFRIFALDLSLELLKYGRSASSSQENRYHRICGDLRWLPTAGPFDLIVSLFTSFGYFPDDEDHRRALCGIVNVLSPDGVFIIDLPHRPQVIKHVSGHPISMRIIEEFNVEEVYRISSDGLRVEKRITISGEQYRRIYFESVRLFTSAELERMLQEAGLRLFENPWGDYDGSPLTEHSPRMIFFGALNA